MSKAAGRDAETGASAGEGAHAQRAKAKGAAHIILEAHPRLAGNRLALRGAPAQHHAPAGKERRADDVERRLGRNITQSEVNCNASRGEL